jgi:DNA-binding MarR family transcriptional regulator
VAKVTTSGYRTLAAFRYEIRKFLAFSEQAARDVGIEPQQHQLLLTLRGLPEGAVPTIGTVAERLSVQHHTAVALVDKLEARGFLERQRSSSDRRVVLLHLTAEGDAILERLSALHQEQLRTVGPTMVQALQAIVGNGVERSSRGVSRPIADGTRVPRAREHAHARDSRGTTSLR